MLKGDDTTPTSLQAFGDTVTASTEEDLSAAGLLHSGPFNVVFKMVSYNQFKGDTKH